MDLLSVFQLERIREKERYDLDHLDEMREQVEEIKNTIGLDFESTKFRDFVDKLEIMEELERKTYETETQIEKLREEIPALKHIIEVDFYLDSCFLTL